MKSELLINRNDNDQQENNKKPKIATSSQQLFILLRYKNLLIKVFSIICILKASPIINFFL